MFDYFRAGENEQYIFVQMPLMLIKDDLFKELSSDAKILYSLLLNRTSLSIKNNWLDEQGYVYIIYTVEQIMEDLNCWERRAVKAMKELKDIGLVRSIRQGLGKPNILYIMNFATTLKHENKAENVDNTQNCQNDNSGIGERTIPEQADPPILELAKGQCSNINLSNIDSIKIDSKSMSESTSAKNTKENNDIDNDSDIITNKETIFSENKKAPATKSKSDKQVESPKYNLDDYKKYEQIIKENIDYSHYAWHDKGDIALIDGLVENMLDVILTEAPAIVRIGKEDKNRDIVKNIYLKLDSSHIDHVISQYKAQRHQITHKNSYLKTMLYTVYSEFDAYFTNQVRADGAIF